MITRQKLEEMDATMTKIEQTNAQTEIMLDFYESKYVASIGGEGIIRKQDIPILQKGVQQVFDIMKDGNWYTTPQLRERTGQEEAGRRMRELRQNGYIVDRRRVGDSRLWEYRLDLSNQHKQSSFVSRSEAKRVKKMFELNTAELDFILSQMCIVPYSEHDEGIVENICEKLKAMLDDLR